MTNPRPKTQAELPEENSRYGVEQTTADPEPEAPESASPGWIGSLRKLRMSVYRLDETRSARRFRLSMDRLEDNWPLSAAVILVAIVAGSMLA